MEIIFKARLVVSNAQHITKKNVDKIVARSSEICKHVHGVPGIDGKTYKEVWKIRKEPQGYIFREVLHNGGICGHHKTVKDCVMKAAGHSHIIISMEVN